MTICCNATIRVLRREINFTGKNKKSNLSILNAFFDHQPKDAAKGNVIKLKT
jgi:hypothetical protein